MIKEVSEEHIIIIVFCPADIYLLKVNSRNTRTRCEICSKLIVKTLERRLLSLLLTLSIFHHLF